MARKETLLSRILRNHYHLLKFSVIYKGYRLQIQVARSLNGRGTVYYYIANLDTGKSHDFVQKPDRDKGYMNDLHDIIKKITNE